MNDSTATPCSDGWIAVTPTSPPTDQAVWLWDATDKIGFIGWRMKNKKGDEWWESAAGPPEWDAKAGEWDLYDDNFGNIEPTHWMPLPMPPNDPDQRPVAPKP